MAPGAAVSDPASTWLARARALPREHRSDDLLVEGYHIMRAREFDAAKAREIVAAHDLCHDLHGKVGPRDFADGCADEQRRHYGCAPDADEVARLRAIVAERDAEEPHFTPAQLWIFTALVFLAGCIAGPFLVILFVP